MKPHKITILGGKMLCNNCKYYHCYATEKGRIKQCDILGELKSEKEHCVNLNLKRKKKK
jgi:hypothetical protein